MILRDNYRRRDPAALVARPDCFRKATTLLYGFILSLMMALLALDSPLRMMWLMLMSLPG